MSYNKLTEQSKVIFLIEPQDHQSAGIDGDSFKVGDMTGFTIIVQFGELTGDSILSIYSGATAGTKTTQESFRYRLSSSELLTADADQWGAYTTIAAGAGLTLTAATYEDFMVAIEMGNDEFTDGQNWITLEIDSTASVLFVSAVAVCEPRFKANQIPTTIA